MEVVQEQKKEDREVRMLKSRAGMPVLGSIAINGQIPRIFPSQANRRRVSFRPMPKGENVPLKRWKEGLTASESVTAPFASRDKPWKRWRSVPREPGTISSTLVTFNNTE
jgi:hypothetical protein